MTYKRLTGSQVPGAENIYRGGPLQNPPKNSAEAQADPSVANENKALKKEVKVLKDSLDSAVAEASAAAKSEVDKKLADENAALKEGLAVAEEAATANVAPSEADPKLVEENTILKKGAKALKVEHKKALADNAKLTEELAQAKEMAENTAPAEPVSTPNLVFMTDVNKVRSVDDDFSKVYCKLSLERDGEAVDGVVVVPHAASKHFKRIGS